MATAAQMRKLALSMPEAEEKSHFEQPDFRVRDKIFAGLSRDGKRGNLKLTPEIQSTIISSDGRSAFTPCAGAWGRSGWTYVDLASTDIPTLEALIKEAWRLVAPKRLVAMHEGAPAAKAKPAKTKTKATRSKK